MCIGVLPFQDKENEWIDFSKQKQKKS